MWWRGNVFICCVWLKHSELPCIYISSRWRLSIRYAVHTIITLNHHITHLALIYILLVMKKTGHDIYKKRAYARVMITEGIKELNTYSNAISPTQLKTVLKLQISQLQPFHCHLSKSYTLFSQILQFQQEIPFSLPQKTK